MPFDILTGEKMDIKDKVAVITGGASGLGLATAKLLKEKGAKLMLLDLNEDNAKAAVEELGDISDYSITNVIEEDSVKAAIDKTCRKIRRCKYFSKLCWYWKC
jgi:NAD(P)-dependent dehydrogenase (short-subunit alcohol dehydrogenase family)